MIVYGDPSFSAGLHSLAEALGARVRDAGAAGLDERRALLIQAGQLEQALADVSPEDACRAETATDAAADWFLQALDGEPATGDLSRLREVVERLRGLPDRPVRVKLPEGYAFYALYPEQYAAAVRAWLSAHSGEPRNLALAVGVRSIGTSLSAVAAATLRKAGWPARRLTTRPSGHPFSRTVELDAGATAGAAFGLVIDEGPGLSGSSMAAVAAALCRAGIPRERIAFFPGHGGEPGGSASDETREWWRAAPRFVRSPADLRWDGCALPEALARRTETLLPDAGPAAPMDDLGGGLWRRAAYADADAWPAACAPFERPKHRVALADGSALLWKFEGLAAGPSGESLADAALARLRSLAAKGWTLPPLNACLGFVATPWVEGPRAVRADLDERFAVRLGEYVADAATAPLPVEAAREGAGRLAEMVYWNTRELLGEEAAIRLTPPQLDEATLAYGDGRLAPCEWVRAADGRWLKTDCAGHALDHTVVGPQPVWWDLAGAVVEWSLNPEQEAALIHAFAARGGAAPLPETLRFYRTAYAAFRAGQCSMCAGMTGDPEERIRLQAASETYVRELRRA